MKLTAPIVFEPLYMERVWGGRKLETLFGKTLPSGAIIGEAWELVDREEAQSVVHTGALRGKTLNELWTEYRESVFGNRYANTTGRFPLLFKLLDAAEKLSVQVHPPAAVAPELKGEPKTEMWYVLAAEPGADLFAGLKQGTSREQFERALQTGHCDALLHRIETQAGDCIFIPSGRVHAIGGGNVIVEVQQNSDTTYRVFDWNRTGLDGKPRALHVQESLRSIDFDDYEPQLQNPAGTPLVQCAYFEIDRWNLDQPREAAPAGDFAVLTCISGKVSCAGSIFGPGEFFLVPASLEERLLTPAAPGTTVLRTRIA
ncbi:MAG: class I mannose-6-phosphate isomerase [Verrucomicrobia bacterium]|nr:class I mannose-6-phosphate isomerase [Verrucomicrobiota bacterium]